jgi:hypothetical protein
VGVATKLSDPEARLSAETGVFDSGLLGVPFVLGWLGSAAYLGGIAILLRRAFTRPAGDLRLAAAARAAIVCGVSQLLFFNALVGVSGVFFWLAVALAAIATSERGRRPNSSTAVASR